METAQVHIARQPAHADRVREKATNRTNDTSSTAFSLLLQHLTRVAKPASAPSSEPVTAGSVAGDEAAAQPPPDSSSAAAPPNSADVAVAAASSDDAANAPPPLDGVSAEAPATPTTTTVSDEGAGAAAVQSPVPDPATASPAPVEAAMSRRAPVPARAIVAHGEAPVAVVMANPPDGAEHAEAVDVETGDTEDAPGAAGSVAGYVDEPAMDDVASAAPAERRLSPATEPVLTAARVEGYAAPVVAPAASEVESTVPAEALDSPDSPPPAGVNPQQPVPVRAADAASPASQAHARAELVSSRPTLETLGAHVVRSVRLGVHGEDTVIRLRLVPETLGEVKVEITSGGSRMALRMTAENAAVRQVLEDQSPQLRHSLAQQGFDLSELIVTDNGAQDWRGGRDLDHAAFNQSGPQTRRAGEDAPTAPAAAVRRTAPHAGALNLFI